MDKKRIRKKQLSRASACGRYFSDTAVYNLDIILSRIIAEGLRRFIQVNKNSTPDGYENIDEWHNDIKEMIYCFEQVIYNYPDDPFVKYLEGHEPGTPVPSEIAYDKSAAYYDRIDAGLQNFAKWLPDMWD